MAGTRGVLVNTAVVIASPTKALARHVYGEGYSHKHHLTVGVAIFVAGVTVSRLADLSMYSIVHALGGGFGDFFGALGLSPMLESFARLGMEE